MGGGGNLMQLKQSKHNCSSAKGKANSSSKQCQLEQLAEMRLLEWVSVCLSMHVEMLVSS